MTWMAWTMPTAVFFICLGVALALLTVYELIRPTSMAKGFLPMATSRGDRFFISLLSAAFTHLFWLGIVGDSVYIASVLSVVWALLLMRWG